MATAALTGIIATGVHYRRELESVFSGTMLSSGKESSTPFAGANPPDLHAIMQQIYQQSRPSTPKDFQEQFRKLKEDTVVFIQGHAQDILAGNYDQDTGKLNRFLYQFFERLEQSGAEEFQRLYGQVGQKVNESLLQLRREVCQGELNNFARDLDALLDKYLTSTTQQQQASARALSSLKEMGQEELVAISREANLRLNEEGYQKMLKQQSLEFWLEKLKLAYGVDFSSDKKPNP